MTIRKFVAKQLANASQAVANDRSKEKAQAAITDGRRKLANWISPDNHTTVSMVQVRVIG